MKITFEFVVSKHVDCKRFHLVPRELIEMDDLKTVLKRLSGEIPPPPFPKDHRRIFVVPPELFERSGFAEIEL